MNGEIAAFARCTFEGDPTPVGFDQIAGDAQPETHALLEATPLVPTVKWLEDFILLLGSDA